DLGFRPPLTTEKNISIITKDSNSNWPKDGEQVTLFIGNMRSDSNISISAAGVIFDGSVMWSGVLSVTASGIQIPYNYQMGPNAHLNGKVTIMQPRN
ncbi:MAG: hypothetical protein ORO03_05755, partial [Alphaproteobacteria bacterium]|nr:hypothetical protein [Alphaproteobacteria bacterium]